MKWSRYSHLFLSKRNGWLLYNSAANSFLKLEPGQEEVIKEISGNPEGYDFSSCPQLYILLRSAGYLVKEGQDEDVYNILKMRRLTAQYANNTLLLTVAVTRACNFDCSYCFEGNRTGSPMSEEVEAKLIDFIKRRKKLGLFITWYGGEPLLAFDRILSMDGKLKAEGIPYGAMIVTNGYLLTDAVIGKLNDLNIQTIQITLDGNRETHDSRRCLKGGGKTYDRIAANLERLMASDFQGAVHIRVNVDGRNEEEFIAVYEAIREKYPEDFDKRISVYPGFVMGDSHPDASCFFDSDKKGRFLAAVAEKYGAAPLPLFPSMPPGGCTLTKRNAYVVGPEGELYKCWDDVGIEELVVGRIDSLTGWNMPLIAKGMVAASYLDSAECRECFHFPICDGGCHKVRMKALEDGNSHGGAKTSHHAPAPALARPCASDVCTYFKHHLDELLELHYEQKTKAKNCLNP